MIAKIGVPSLTRSLWKFKLTVVVLILLFLTDCKSFTLDSPLENDWTCPIVSTLIVSVLPFLILFLVPLSTQCELRHENRILIFLSFASGGLLGDAFLHLIPHAQSHKQSQSEVGGWVLIGFLGFLIIEKVTEVLHSRRELKQQQQQQQSENSEEIKVVKKEIKVTGYLNLIADFAHNFTDGLAIGASYRISPALGVTTTIAVLLHEIPHEIGDFAILVRSGCSIRKAIYLQLLTAVGALSGTIISLWIGGTSSETWMLGVTAGGFIYIGTVSVIPEMLKRSEVGLSVKQLVGFCLGLGIMYAMVVYEDDLKNYLMDLQDKKEQEDSVVNIYLQKFQQYVWQPWKVEL